jgi:hypothetical protein
MKQFFICLAICLIAGFTATFSQSTPGTTEFKSKLRPSLALPLETNAETTEATILTKLKETGYKPEKNGGFLNKKSKEEGFYKFSGVILPELANQQLDLYFKVDPTTTSDSRSSITLMVSKGYENFISRDQDSSTFEASEKFLNSFVTKTEVFQINKQMEQQKESLAKSEKKWNDIRSKQDDARKKITELETEIKNLQTEETTQKQDVDKQRSMLKELEDKRSSVRN